MVEAREYNASDGSVSERQVDTSALGDQRRPRLVRAAAVRYLNNQRAGTHSTKTRGEVHRTGRKPYRQKGTGRARAGDYKSPLWRGGGVVFGPKPRSYRSGMPSRARREALRTALGARFAEGKVSFLAGGEWERPSTKKAAAMLKALGADTSAVVVVGKPQPNLYLSLRNLPRVDVVPAQDVNALHVTRREHVILEGDALEVIQGRLGPARPVSQAEGDEEETRDAD